ncbi:TPA: ead/Ea22-like family protein [Citrobacter braakii]|uniref:ead/Ea22-like family protein n=1 Tax=Citrobacter braakii TaxID=57706 RepID=UPI001B9805D0|nr:ead/Ea22-like family protein [Citrobacter braakii]
MTALNKQALRERYSPQPVPKCHICGAEMTVQRMSASSITYGCTGSTYDDTGSHYAEGRSIADDHYAQSRVTIFDVSDPEVLSLLDELEAAEKRIAELEARTVTLPTPYPKGYGLVSDKYNFALEECADAIRAAGIGVKGE